jgi:2,4-dienoyl-CoA reductase-like NADH-dependent reductase (Old Yellow Enzyme family)
VAAWRAVVDAVHSAGAPIVPQVWHQGVLRLPGSPPFPDAPSFSPSGRYGDLTKTDAWFRAKAELLSQPGRIPSDTEIVEVLDSFSSAAEHAVAAGFDGFAIHGAHGYLVDAFLWKETNVRTDRWGGDTTARTLFAVELVKRVRRVLGEDRPIIYRFSQWKQQDYRAKLAETPDELEKILGPLADAGVDLFDASVRYFDTPAFAGSDLSLAGWAKKLTGKLSGAVGGIGFDKGMYDTFDNKATGGVNNLPRVLRRFEAGEFDIVSVGRAILNDPNWVQKAKRGEPFAPFDFETLKRLI